MDREVGLKPFSAYILGNEQSEVTVWAEMEGAPQNILCCFRSLGHLKQWVGELYKGMHMMPGTGFFRQPNGMVEHMK